ncbi:MAG: DNA polymerase III subunit beta [bacterium]|nr:MAG: DNA polymerase III subunit beta [bacterium]
MKIRVALGELSKKMHAISSVVPSKTTMPILSTVLITADGEGIELSATDLDISVTSKITGTADAGGKIAVPAKKIAEIVKSLTGDEVSMDVTGEKLTLTCGKSRFVINGRSAEDFPKIPKQESKTSFKMDPELIQRLVQKTIYAVSNDLTRPQLCGVLWELDKDGISMISTDGHRLAKVEAKTKLGDVQKTSVIVPPKALSMLKLYSEGEEEIKVSLGENSISFSMSESSIYSRLLEGPFPNYTKVIPEGNDKELIVDRQRLSDATKRVAILSDALTHQIVFSLEKDKLKLNVSTQEIGEAHEEIEASFDGEPFDIGYNANYVLDILRTMESENVAFRLDRPDNAGMVEPVETAEDINQTCIIMPLRIS